MHRLKELVGNFHARLSESFLCVEKLEKFSVAVRARNKDVRALAPTKSSVHGSTSDAKAENAQTAKKHPYFWAFALADRCQNRTEFLFKPRKPPVRGALGCALRKV